MQLKNLIAVAVAAACFGAAAYAGAPARRPAPVSRAVTIRSQYDPFALQRQAVAARAAAVAPQRIAGTVVRPPYRPATRSPYQPPTRGPYLP